MKKFKVTVKDSFYINAESKEVARSKAVNEMNPEIEIKEIE